MVRLDFLMTYWILAGDYREGPYPTRTAATAALDTRVKSAAAA